MSGSDLFTGTLDILILRTLAPTPLHGYAIGRAIRDGSEGVLSVEEGALYPALHRLEARGLLEAEWGKTDTGRRAKFYQVTKDGHEHLGREAARWVEFSGAVAAILGPDER
ncbi:MAG: PadR family transcriptional regulator [Gemmatimonadetes bacterium]|nr:PadR family transcriptional regulator [Gemmatimonadota bacterium]MDA1102506.1 PadR family transcriptional regulator [Gemmatimonadota bacterium]